MVKVLKTILTYIVLTVFSSIASIESTLVDLVADATACSMKKFSRYWQIDLVGFSYAIQYLAFVRGIECIVVCSQLDQSTENVVPQRFYVLQLSETVNSDSIPGRVK